VNHSGTEHSVTRLLVVFKIDTYGVSPTFTLVHYDNTEKSPDMVNFSRNKMLLLYTVYTRPQKVCILIVRQDSLIENLTYAYYTKQHY